MSSRQSFPAQWQEWLEQRPFQPPRWLANGHLQTIVASRQRRRFPWGWRTAIRESIELSDGARIRATWIEVGRFAPTLIAVHGMGGSDESAYMLAFSHKAFHRGWNALLLNLHDRGSRRKVPRVFDAGCSGAVKEIVEGFRDKRGLSEILLVGVSMGGNIALKLLGEWGPNTPRWLVGGAVISPLVDLSSSWQLMERPSNRLYQRYYLNRLKTLALSFRQRLGRVVDFDRLDRVRTVRQFDELVTVPAGEYSDVETYYRVASASRVVERVRVPVLAIHAQDDPFLPWEPLCRQEVTMNPWMRTALTQRGGHVGFLEAKRIDVDRCWAENRVLDFFSLVLGRS